MAFCKDYHYCPKRRRRQRFERMQKLHEDLEDQKIYLKAYGIDFVLISDHSMRNRRNEMNKLSKELKAKQRKEKERIDKFNKKHQIDS